MKNYVYIVTNGISFYVGKSKGRVIFQNYFTCSPDMHLLLLFNSDEWYIERIIECMDENAHSELESQLISKLSYYHNCVNRQGAKSTVPSFIPMRKFNEIIPTLIDAKFNTKIHHPKTRVNLCMLEKHLISKVDRDAGITLDDLRYFKELEKVDIN
jgi:hypothetical protein